MKTISFSICRSYWFPFCVVYDWLLTAGDWLTFARILWIMPSIAKRWSMFQQSFKISKFFKKYCVRIKKRISIGSKKTSRELEGKNWLRSDILLRNKAVMELKRIFAAWYSEQKAPGKKCQDCEHAKICYLNSYTSLWIFWKFEVHLSSMSRNKAIFKITQQAKDSP